MRKSEESITRLLDGGLHLDDGSESQRDDRAASLEACGNAARLQGYLTLSSLMFRVERAAPPAIVALANSCGGRATSFR